MDEILKILERHPTWLIQVERMRDRGDSHPGDWVLRMKKVEPKGSRNAEYMAECIVSEQSRRQAKVDVIAFWLRRMEKDIELKATGAAE